ncbi:MAG TPA: DNA polymerase III subunit gamma/tau [Syntrophomonadaceae bacterium]|nr:DNA polymerase III subunit gamma/tau [Syntrophomonadaceae bacterium]
MAYLALYRAWRPRSFEEVVGQENIITALRNAVKEGKTAHAYLFSGPRGTGKTSVAKIIAKALNCEDLVDGQPCNQCSSCLDINQGNFMDVIEIDAASNRGIDEIRDLREKVRIAPAQGKTKVYIIDEVHMLTTEAFNALLKTIEEPPEGVAFILATTEPQKIPATIRSRCQVYNFRRLTPDEILTRVQKVAESNHIQIDEEAGSLIARRANGGLRDALSILDQVQSYRGNHISKEDVLDVLGLVDDVFLVEMLQAALQGETAELVEKLNLALLQGKEAQQLARESTYYLRDLLLYSLLGKRAELQVVGKESIKSLAGQTKLTTPDKIMQALRLMMDTTDRLRFSEGNRFLLEIAFLEISTILQTREETKSEIKQSPAPARSQPVEKKGKDQNRDRLWVQVLAGVKEQKIPTHALLSQGKLLGLRDDVVYVGFRKGYKFHKERMEERANREIVEDVLNNLLHREVKLEVIFIDDEQQNDMIVKKAIEFFGEDIVEIID